MVDDDDDDDDDASLYQSSTDTLVLSCAFLALYHRPNRDLGYLCGCVTSTPLLLWLLWSSFGLVCDVLSESF